MRGLEGAAAAAAPAPRREAPPAPHLAGPGARLPRTPAEPEWTGATETLTVREALRDAMAEEMRRDDKVFLMGEEVAQYQGAYKISQGLLDEFGAAGDRHADHRARLHRPRGRARPCYGLKPIVEFMTFNFAMQAIDHIINSAAKTLYMSGGQISSRSCSAAPTARPRGSAPSTPSATPAGTPTVPASRWSRPIRRPTPRGC